MSPGGVDRALLRRHLLALDEALQRLAAHADVALDAYVANGDLQWLVERGLLVASQNVLDIASHLAAARGRDAPDYASAIDALAELDILPREFARRLRGIAGFRNVLVHGYLTVNPRVVHHVLTEELQNLRAFMHHIETALPEVSRAT